MTIIMPRYTALLDGLHRLEVMGNLIIFRCCWSHARQSVIKDTSEQLVCCSQVLAGASHCTYVCMYVQYIYTLNLYMYRVCTVLFVVQYWL